MKTPTPVVSVVTVTRGRPQLLSRAHESVLAQAIEVPVEHLIVIDDCAESAALELVGGDHIDTRVMFKHRRAGESSGPSRLGRLRNMAVAQAGGDWIAFLDDDNTYEPEHISSLLAAASAHKVNAVHSERRMFHRDGRPFVDHVFPWTRDGVAAEKLYWACVERGVFEPGSNILHDQVDLSPGGPRIVDMSAWLIRATLLRSIPFREEYSARDWQLVVTEDAKLLRDLVNFDVEIKSSRRPTLNYYLGGYSNEAIPSVNSWQPPDDTRDIALSIVSSVPPSWRGGEGQ